MTRIKPNETLDIIDSYKVLKAKVTEINFKLRECETGIFEIPESEKQKLIIEREKTQIQIERIDNALSILNDEEKDIMEIVHIEHRRYWVVEEKLNYTHQSIKTIEAKAIEKMKPFILGTKGE
jgi:DNA-directed RNA polymerase sigma subunit (sigma70/sigma32)